MININYSIKLADLTSNIRKFWKLSGAKSDAIPQGQHIPCGESTMWGDYHAREVVLYLQKIIQKEPYLTFWGGNFL